MNERGRTAFLIAGLLGVLVAGGFLLYRSGWLERQFARDADNPEELARLKDADPKLPSVAEAATGWPQWRGPHRDGRAPAGPLRTDWDKTPPRLLWRAECGGGYASFAVVSGRLYTQDRKNGTDRVLCFDALNGQPLWEHAFAGGNPGSDRNYANGPRATPTVEGNRVYAVSGGGKFLCVEAPDTPGQSPKLLWEHDLIAEFQAEVPQWGVACSPLIAGDLAVVIAGGRDGSVVAFDKASGQLRWKFGSNPAGYSSPIAATFHGVPTILAFVGDALFCMGRDGTLLASFGWKTPYNGNIATPIVIDDYVFISSAYGMGCALLRAKPDGSGLKLEPVYTRRNKVMLSHHSTCVYRDGFLYGFTGDTRTHLACVDFRSGNEVEGWIGFEKSGEKGTAILADRHLIILTERGELALVEATPAECRVVAKVPSGLSGKQNWSLPVLVDGRLYLRDDSQILCLDVRP